MQNGSIIQVSDNSGALKVLFIRQLWPSSMYNRIQTKAGDLILISVRKVLSNNFFKLKKGQLYKAIIVLLNKFVFRKFGYLRFFCNSVVLLSKKNQPFATRVLTPVLAEVRLKKHMRIVTLSISVF